MLGYYTLDPNGSLTWQSGPAPRRPRASATTEAATLGLRPDPGAVPPGSRPYAVLLYGTHGGLLGHYRPSLPAATVAAVQAWVDGPDAPPEVRRRWTILAVQASGPNRRTLEVRVTWAVAP